MKYTLTATIFTTMLLLLTGCDLDPDTGGSATDLHSQPVAAQDFVRLVNEHREGMGLSAFEWHPDIAAAALFHSRDMRDRSFFSHNDPDGNTPWDRLRDHGVSYSGAAENIAFGQTSGEQVLQAWLNSPGHRTNIENETYTHHGVGFVADGNYWTHKFVRDPR